MNTFGSLFKFKLTNVNLAETLHFKDPYSYVSVTKITGS
jgi:hypothetical protein